jgi:hypothetical protein
MSLFSGQVSFKYVPSCGLKAVGRCMAPGAGLAFYPYVASRNSEAGSVLALGGGGLSIEASSNLEKRRCPWACMC